MWGAIWVLAWPVSIDAILGSLVGLVDTILAAAISVPAADAIGSASYLLWFIGLFFASLDIGATALISRSIGSGKKAVANAAVGQTLLLAILVGAVLGVLLYIAAPLLARAVNASPEAARDFTTYMRIIAFDVPVMGLMYAGIACLRGAGDTFSPMRALMVVNLVNLGASWALAGVDLATTSVSSGQVTHHVWLRNPFEFNLGVMGIGIGTLMGHAAGAALILATLARGRSSIRILWHRLRPHWVTMARVLRIGLPSFAEMVGMWFGNYLVIMLVRGLGEGVMGSHIIAIRVESLSFQIGFAIAIASATLAGQYLGAGMPAMARLAILRCTMVASGIMGLLGLFFIFMPHTIVGLVSGQAAHLEHAPQALFITGLVQIPFAMSIVLRQAMRGCGDVKITMWITWVCTYLVRLPLAYLLSGVVIHLPASLGGGTISNPSGLEPSLGGLWLGLCIEIVIRMGLFLARFTNGGWARKRV